MCDNSSLGESSETAESENVSMAKKRVVFKEPVCTRKLFFDARLSTIGLSSSSQINMGSSSGASSSSSLPTTDRITPLTSITDNGDNDNLCDNQRDEQQRQQHAENLEQQPGTVSANPLDQRLEAALDCTENNNNNKDQQQQKASTPNPLDLPTSSEDLHEASETMDYQVENGQADVDNCFVVSSKRGVGKDELTRPRRKRLFHQNSTFEYESAGVMYDDDDEATQPLPSPAIRQYGDEESDHESNEINGPGPEDLRDENGGTYDGDSTEREDNDEETEREDNGEETEWEGDGK